MPSTVGQFLTTKKYETLINRNSDNPSRIVQLTHLYLTLKEDLQGKNIKMKPIKNGILLSIPHLGNMRIYILDDKGKHQLKETNLSKEVKLSKNLPTSFFHAYGDVYFIIDKHNSSKLNKNGLQSILLLDKDYVRCSVRSAMEYYMKRRVSNVYALNN